MKSTMARSLSDAATYVLERFTHYGIDVPARSRFKQLHNAVCNDDGSSRGYISEKDPHFETAREALRDFKQLEFFFDQIVLDPEKGKYVPIIKRIVKDSVLPQDDIENSHGRDAQAEAFVFGVCKNAGINPAFEEPDVTCTMDDCRVGIAVKRIKSSSQLEKRLMKAAEQIQKASMPGIISAEVTLAVNPENLSIVTNQHEDHIRSWWTTEMKKRVRQLNDAGWPAVGANGVLGVFLHEHCPVCLNGDYTLRSMTYGIETASKKNRIMWLEFKNKFIKGLPELQE